MVEFKHILCPTDLSEPSARSLSYAAALAKWYEALLTVLHVVPSFEPMSVRPTSLEGTVQLVNPPSHDEVVASLRQFVEASGLGPLNPLLEAEAGDPARTIVDQAISLPADLVVVGTHGRSGFERFVLGSVAEKVLRKSPCPVLAVPPHATARAPVDVRFENVLCPIDFSPASLQAFGFAMDLARQSGGSVTVLHVIEWMAEDQPRGSAVFDVPAYREHLVDDARGRMKALLVGEPREGTTAIQEAVVFGRAHREVLRMASDTPPDLIVMGAQGRGGIGLALFGSTTQEVVRGAPCPVLSVRAVPAVPVK